MIRKVDKHGVTEYKTWLILAITVASIFLTVSLASYILYVFESAQGNANIVTYKDAIWTIYMVMTTIGFGDFYPITLEGRVTCISAFLLGAIEIGILVGIISTSLNASKSIQNRELRTMLAEVMRKLEVMEDHLGMPVNVSKDSHYLDVVFGQVPYSSKWLRNGWLTMGKDSSGMYFIAVDGYDSGTNQEVHRWIPCDNSKDMEIKFGKIVRNDYLI